MRPQCGDCRRLDAAAQCHHGCRPAPHAGHRHQTRDRSPLRLRRTEFSGIHLPGLSRSASDVVARTLPLPSEDHQLLQPTLLRRASADHDRGSRRAQRHHGVADRPGASCSGSVQSPRDRNDPARGAAVTPLRADRDRYFPGEQTESGIISPYNEQVNALHRELGGGIDVATVHKFQGREKEAIILSTVDDQITAFTDDPHLLNVAVSRAKRQFTLVTSSNEQPDSRNIADLLAYIDYNGGKITESAIHSVFDLLYEPYAEAR
ncbi:AAA domain-containing protein, partial [Alistipes sp. CAG:268]|uniref:AAA domain-containing protein n=1 Tax=Alistipes sp. CAG:268 TaxID=1262693 RepID=UPI0034E966C9